MTKEELEEYKKKFKESDAYKWYNKLTYEQREKLIKFTIGDVYFVHDSINISSKGIIKLHKLHLEGNLEI